MLHSIILVSSIFSNTSDVGKQNFIANSTYSCFTPQFNVSLVISISNNTSTNITNNYTSNNTSTNNKSIINNIVNILQIGEAGQTLPPLPNNTQINISKPPDNPVELISPVFLNSVINSVTNYSSNYKLIKEQMKTINQGLSNVIGKII